MIVAHLIQTASRLPTDTSALKSAISALESSIPALESEIARLESSSIPWEHWAWFFTALVLLGVLLELWVIRHDWRDEMEEWAIWYFIGIIQSPDRPPIIKTLVEVASVLLIGIGIAGELGTGIEIAVINGALRSKSAELRSRGDELRTKSDQLLVLVTQQAGTAEHNAALAQQSAKDAGVDAGTAKTKAETVDQLAKHIDAELAQAEWLMSARTILNRDDLANEMKGKYKGRDVLLRSYIGDQEGYGLCIDLWSVTKAAEMSPVEECGRAPLSVPMGNTIEISGPDVNESMDLATMLVRIGRIRGGSGVTSAIKAPRLTMFVGVKGAFVIGQARGVTIPAKKQTKKQSAKP